MRKEPTERSSRCVRNVGAAEILEMLWRYAARDFRDIGHKAIYTANSWRTLQTIGWRHAEPVLRSLAYALLEHEGENPARRDAEPDRPWRENLERVGRIRGNWEQGTVTPPATTDFLKTLRGASASDASDQVVELLNKGVSPASVWDGIFLKAGELLMQQPGIVGIHCVTSVNALHYGYQASGNDETRRLLLLQAPAFLALFRKAMAGRGMLREEMHLDTLPKAEVKAGPDAIPEILADISKDRVTAARKTLALLENPAVKPEALMTAARRLIFSKGTDSHDYKFSSAALEDYYHTTAPWRARYLAASMFNLKGSGDRDTRLIERARSCPGQSIAVIVCSVENLASGEALAPRWSTHRGANAFPLARVLHRGANATPLAEAKHLLPAEANAHVHVRSRELRPLYRCYPATATPQPARPR